MGMVAGRGKAVEVGGFVGPGMLGTYSGPRSCHPLTLGTEDYHLNSECTSDVACPHKCRCEASVVECSSLKLSKIPERIPQSTAEL